MRRRKWSIDVAVGVALLALAEVVIWANPFVSFGVAVAAATGWCIWLDRDPAA
jgi:hypothetical protein